MMAQSKSLLGWLVASLIAMTLASIYGSTAARAVGGPPAPGWEVFGRFEPTNLPPGGHGFLRLYVYNVGGVTSTEGPTVTDTLPEGVEAEPVEGCEGTTKVICKLGVMEPSAPGVIPVGMVIPIHIATSVATMINSVDRVTVDGGGTLGPAEAEIPVSFGSGPAGLGLANVDGFISNVDGTVDTQAGSHPYELTLALAINNRIENGVELPTGGEMHALNVALPAGLIGDPHAVPRCTRTLFDGEGCPRDTQVGEDDAQVAGAGAEFPVYNLVPPPGVAAQFGFDFSGTRTFLDARVRSGGDYGITEHAEIPQNFVVFNTITIWGEPGEHGTGAKPMPFLTLPTSCGTPQRFELEPVGTWQRPRLNPAPASFLWHDNKGNPVSITGCDRLVHFQPTMNVVPDTSFSDSPAGLVARVVVPQGLNPEGLATSGLKETTVTLPEGVVINPAQATGLAACLPEEAGIPVGEEDGEEERFDGPSFCPAASKIGSDEIITPVLQKPLTGSIYLLQSEPPDIELLLMAGGEGVNLKLIGTVHLDESTGRITTTFKGTKQYPGTPDAPLNEFVLSFSGGAQAALITPPTCGIYSSSADFTPWASPFVEDALVSSSFQITAGPGGTGSCTAPLPFVPTLKAGSTTDQAGGYTGFSMLLQRPDGQQRIKSLQFKTPPGLLGMISKIPLCLEPQADEGNCPAASQIGHTVAGAGAGPYPFYLPQNGAPPAPIYLTGFHNGAPFGLSIVVPVVAGPFDLGTKVIRASIAVDPKTAQITITTDASGPYSIPTILDGVPADLRSINAVIDKREFMFNPTNCTPMSFSGTSTSAEGRTAPLASRFQVGSCAALKFKPKLKVTTSAKASRRNGASLTFKLTYPTTELGTNQATAQANIGKFKVELPKRLPSRLTTLQKACLAAVFEANPASCPAESVVGQATARTPVLPVPLTGPAYFVSHGGEAFPSLIMVLQGDGVTVDLESTTFISKKGITSGTLKQVPDVPVSSFELALPQGPHSALAAVGNLCTGKATLATEYVGQNNAHLNIRTPLTVTGCKKKHKPKKTNAHRKHKE
jgi:hypothetical protein